METKEKLISRKKAQELYNQGYAVDGIPKQYCKNGWQRCMDYPPNDTKFWSGKFRTAHSNLKVLQSTDCISEKERWKTARKNKDLGFILQNPEKYSKFIAIDDGTYYKKGDIVKLEYNDDSYCPYFENISTCECIYISWYNLKPYKEQKELPTNNIKLRIESVEQSVELQKLLFKHTDAMWKFSKTKVEKYDVAHLYIKDNIITHSSCLDEEWFCKKELQEVSTKKLIKQLKKLDKKPKKLQINNIKVHTKTAQQNVELQELLFKYADVTWVSGTAYVKKENCGLNYMFIQKNKLTHDGNTEWFCRKDLQERPIEKLIKRLRKFGKKKQEKQFNMRVRILTKCEMVEKGIMKYDNARPFCWNDKGQMDNLFGSTVDVLDKKYNKYAVENENGIWYIDPCECEIIKQ